MKALPKRKGNCRILTPSGSERSLNESPSEKEGKSWTSTERASRASLNESPSEKEGKWLSWLCRTGVSGASMKALPKRKGNRRGHRRGGFVYRGLNESPSEKEGKCSHLDWFPFGG